MRISPLPLGWGCAYGLFMTPIKAGECECVGLNLNRRGGRLDVYVGVPKWVLPNEYEGRCLEERFRCAIAECSRMEIVNVSDRCP